MALLLGGCGETLKGLQQDFSSFGNSVSTGATNLKDSTAKALEKKEPSKAATAVLSDGTCPPISVDPQLASMSEFYDMENPKTGTEVSTIDLVSTKSACNKDGEYLAVEIQLTFKGELGPKAKRKDNDRPFFAYPYFVAVTDNNNSELAKELFAASVTYDKNQDRIELVETIRQKLPLNDDGTTPAYQIKIGFQLTEEQLFYNASR